MWILILLLFGATLQQDITKPPTEEDIKIRKQILEFLAPYVTQETSEEICLNQEDLLDDGSTCFSKTFPSAGQVTAKLINSCSSLNYAVLAHYIHYLHYYDLDDLHRHILLKCLHSLPAKISTTDYASYIYFLEHHVGTSNPWWRHPHAVNVFMKEFLSVIRNNNSTFDVFGYYFILKAWRPFSTNKTGLVVYKGGSHEDIQNSTSVLNINKDNVDVMFYIPSAFLTKLAENLSIEDKKRIRILVIMLKKTNLVGLLGFSDTEVLGISFTDVCINNELTMIKIWYREGYDSIELTRKEYSQYDFEPSGCAIMTCNSFDIFFLSLRAEKATTDSCTNLQSKFSNMGWAAKQFNGFLLPTKFCMTEDCVLPVIHCSRFSTDYIGDHFNSKCYEDIYISNITHQLYKHFQCCLVDTRYCKVDFGLDEVQTYTDVLMLAKLFKANTFHTNLNLDLLDKGLEFLTKGTSHSNDWSCVGHMFSMAGYDTFNQNLVIIKENYIIISYTVMVDTGPIGFVLYKNNSHDDINTDHIHYIMPQNASNDYSADDTVDTVIYTTRDGLMNRNFHLNTIIVRNFNPTNKYVCRSNIVLAYRNDYGNAKLAVYLKATEYSLRTEGYWFTIDMSYKDMKMFCLSELSESMCNTDKHLTIYTFDFLTGVTSQINIQNRTTKLLDMLSQMTVSINPRMMQIVLDYSDVFRIVTHVESILSMVGLFCIFVSALVVKGWWKIKFNTIQLALTSTFEIAFLLLDLDTITQMRYMVFYYFVLAQFTWISIIGYQYFIFVKVFATPSLNKKASMIIGWVTPGLIMLPPSIIYSECLQCNLCYKNQQIFNYFVIAPIFLAVVTNLVFYFVVMYNISRIGSAASSDEIRKTQLKTSILFSCLLGIICNFLLALMSPWPRLTLVGSCLFYVVTPSQGFVLFLFGVVLDKDTRIQWYSTVSNLFSKINCKKIRS